MLMYHNDMLMYHYHYCQKLTMIC